MPAEAVDVLVAELAAVVGTEHVLVDQDVRAGYERDFTGRYGAASTAVVRPADGREVSEVLRICAAHQMAVVPQGGNTGAVGGGVPRGGEIVVSTRRLSAVGEIDPDTGCVLVGAGVTLASVQAIAAQAGWEMPLDLGARDSATVGGLVATDAGGAMALAHGTMRDRVAGLAVALPDGEMVERLGGLRKDNAGYAWSSLMVGSEGTLGIITAVLVRLVPRRGIRVSALLSVRDAQAAIELVSGLRRCVPSLEAADFFLDEGVTLVGRTLDGVRLPLHERAPCYVVLECASHGDPTPELAAGLEAFDRLICEQVAAEDLAGRRDIWAVREALPDALVRAGVPVKIDVAVPVRAVAEFADAVGPVVASVVEGGQVILWGHLGDGNVHVNVLAADHAGDGVEAAVLRLASDLGGTVSAEHGVGVSKTKHLGLVRSASEIRLLHSLKAAFDPTGLMNPGVVLPAARVSRAVAPRLGRVGADG